jgi:hypothetical protein
MDSGFAGMQVAWEWFPAYEGMQLPACAGMYFAGMQLTQECISQECWLHGNEPD